MTQYYVASLQHDSGLCRISNVKVLQGGDDFWLQYDYALPKSRLVAKTGMIQRKSRSLQSSRQCSTNARGMPCLLYASTRPDPPHVLSSNYYLHMSARHGVTAVMEDQHPAGCHCVPNNMSVARHSAYSNALISFSLCSFMVATPKWWSGSQCLLLHDCLLIPEDCSLLMPRWHLEAGHIGC